MNNIIDHGFKNIQQIRNVVAYHNNKYVFKKYMFVFYFISSLLKAQFYFLLLTIMEMYLFLRINVHDQN